jgi:hypothetical protein
MPLPLCRIVVGLIGASWLDAALVSLTLQGNDLHTRD